MQGRNDGFATLPMKKGNSKNNLKGDYSFHKYACMIEKVSYACKSLVAF